MMNNDPDYNPDAQGSGDLMKRLADASRVERSGARMLPADRKLTEAEIKDQCRQIDRWLQENGVSRAQAAEQIEVKRSLVSQVLNGNYPGDVEKYVRKLAALMQAPDAPQIIRSRPELAPVSTSTLLDMQATVETARAIGTNAIIVGESGSGKTTYAMARAAEKNTCMYVHLDDDKYSRTRLLRRINESLRLGGDGGYHGDAILRRISTAIAGDRRVLFVDNCHVLDKSGLWVLHSLHDRTGAIIRRDRTAEAVPHAH